METSNNPNTTIIVIFGAGGDLTHRKLMPAIYNLYLNGLLPQKFAVLGLDIKDKSNEIFRKELRDGIDHFSRRGKTENSKWQIFGKYLNYQTSDFNDDKTYSHLKKTAWQVRKRMGWRCQPYILYGYSSFVHRADSKEYRRCRISKE